MGHLSITGLQWGDEGKGKVVDFMSLDADVVIRYQGGHNAGHTLAINDKVYKLSLLPSGVVREHTLSFIGNGVAFDPFAFLKEVETLTSQGVAITPERLKISDRAPLILPFHQQKDSFKESSDKKGIKIGTTKRGIGPSIEDKVARYALRVGDLFYPDYLKERLEALVDEHNVVFAYYKQPLVNVDEVFQMLMSVRDHILPFVVTGWSFLHDLHKEGKKFLFEGAQGVLLDVDHGTYPFVTSSNTCTAQCGVGAGINVLKDTYHLGVVKAYTTRVGEGPFPTEDHGDDGHKMGSIGKEFGVVTGRSRRCGWFDAVAAKQAAVVCGSDGLAVMKLDVLDDFDTLKICTSYLVDGKVCASLPASGACFSHIAPQYEEIEGWKTSTKGITKYDDLPEAAKKYLKRIEELVEIPVVIISTGPERSETIVLKNPLQDHL